jgi:FkbM family methyltransferase
VSERTEDDRAGRRWAATAIWLATAALALIGATNAVRHAALLAGGSRLALVIAASSVATAGIGAVVAGKTGNRIGWLLAGGALALSVGLGAGVSAAMTCGSPAGWLGFFAVTGAAAWWAALTSSIALYPSGQTGGGRRAGALIVGPVLAWVGVAIVAGAALTQPGASALTLSLGTCLRTPADTTLVAGFAILAAGYAAALALALRRVRSLQGEERRRLLPVAAVATVGAVLLVMAPVFEAWARPSSGDAPWVIAAWIAAGLGLPLAVAVSVIRCQTFGIYRFASYLADYRLWTAGYAALAVAAATGVGWGIAAALGLSRQPVAVGIATLAAAAAIFPLWRRRQAIVDARFGQRQPDPAASLETLAASLTDETADPLRGSVFDLLERFAPMVVVEGAEGMRFAVRTNDAEIGRHTFVHGAYDLDPMRRALDRLGRELGDPAPLSGRTVLDVGANIGISIVPLLRLFGAERGIAVEPEPGNVEMLRLNLALNDLSDRVQVLAVGLSDRDGSLALELSSANPGDHRMRVPGTPTTPETAARPALDVPVRRLDALVEKGEVDAGSLGLIWVDVQGHEGHVLAGARALLAAKAPMVTEFWPTELMRAGGLDLFEEIVAAHFTGFVDLRAADADGPALPTSGIGELARRYPGPGDFTDLLLLP